jgi:hypothetical protein
VPALARAGSDRLFLVGMHPSPRPLQRLLAAEQALERKERKAEKLERIFLAEEEQEQKILKQKLDAARAVSRIRRYRAAFCDWAVSDELTNSRPLSLSLSLSDLQRRNNATILLKRSTKEQLN